jgi:hypothetical protein
MVGDGSRETEEHRASSYSSRSRVVEEELIDNESLPKLVWECTELEVRRRLKDGK